MTDFVETFCDFLFYLNKETLIINARQRPFQILHPGSLKLMDCSNDMRGLRPRKLSCIKETSLVK